MSDDPYAHSIFFPASFHRNAAMRLGANAGKAALGLIATEPNGFDWGGDARPQHEWDAISLPTKAGSHRDRADARAIYGLIMATLASAFFTPCLYVPFVGRAGDAALAAPSPSWKC
jgi:hypothetical protein